MKRKTRFNDAGNVVDPGDGTKYFDDDELAQASRRSLKDEIDSMQGMYDKEPGDFMQGMYEKEPGEQRKVAPIKAAPKAPPIKDVPGGGGRGTMAGRRAIDDIMRDAGGGGRGRSMGRTAADVDTFTPGRGVGRAEIPVETSMRGPEKRSSPAMNMSDTERNLMNLLMASMRGMSRNYGKVVQNNRALVSAEHMAKPMLSSAKEAVKGAASRAGESLKEAGRTVSKTFNPPPKATQTSKASKETAEAMEKFSKGGSASRRADGCATRGKTRGKIY